MGTKEKTRVSKIQKRTRSLADALFSTVQQRVLAYLFGQPERSFFATELIKLTGGGSGAVQRELIRLADSELVTVTRIGTQKHYTVYTPANWRRKQKEGNTFVVKVTSQSKIFLIGAEED